MGAHGDESEEPKGEMDNAPPTDALHMELPKYVLEDTPYVPTDVLAMVAPRHVLEMAGAIPIPECTVLHEPMGRDGAVLLHLFEGAPQVPKVVRGMEVPKDVLEMEVAIPTPEYTRALGLSEEPKEVLDEAPQVPRYLLCVEMLQDVLEMDGGLPIPDFTWGPEFFRGAQERAGGRPAGDQGRAGHGGTGLRAGDGRCYSHPRVFMGP